ncbi:cyclin-dependent kinase 9-like [Littorina saxatilis]|uniref:Protein kinase domain-containing protein n=1 Tax=Littorina saxatilis TaxID=31220 RepID=A0AAN9AX21_9CAEN
MSNGQPSGAPSTDDDIDFPFCPNASEKYEKIAKIGQGTFGEVFKARERKSKARLVAMKKVLMDNEKEGFPITALREIKILQLLDHENVVRLIEICRTRSGPYTRNKNTFYLVCEFCEHDLAGLLSNANIKFKLAEIKNVMQQLLNGLYYVHVNRVIHRDMKAANILITRTGVLKLADFGLSRAYKQTEKANRFTNRVVTLWYRPPELLLGARDYGPEIDLWGAGCIMAEMWTRTPIMQGGSEQSQLKLISQLCGSLTPEVWPGISSLDLYGKLELPEGQKRRVRDRMRGFMKDELAVDLVDKLLCVDPSKRIDSNKALDHDYFWSEPLPLSLGPLLSKITTSMFELHAPKRRSQWMHSRHQGQQQQPRQPPPQSDQHFERIF